MSEPTAEQRAKSLIAVLCLGPYDTGQIEREIRAAEAAAREPLETAVAELDKLLAEYREENQRVKVLHLNVCNERNMLEREVERLKSREKTLENNWGVACRERDAARAEGYRAGLEEERERCRRAVCAYCGRDEPIVRHPQWGYEGHKIAGEVVRCKAAAIRAKLDGEETG